MDTNNIFSMDDEERYLKTCFIILLLLQNKINLTLVYMPSNPGPCSPYLDHADCIAYMRRDIAKIFLLVIILMGRFDNRRDSNHFLPRHFLMEIILPFFLLKNIKGELCLVYEVYMRYTINHFLVTST